MKRSASVLTLAIATLLFGAAKAKAAPIQWSFNWTPNKTTVFSNTGGINPTTSTRLTFTNEVLAYGEGSSDTVVTNITALSQKPGSLKDTFIQGDPNGNVNFTLTLRDGPSEEFPFLFTGPPESFTFSGNFYGTVSKENSIIRFQPFGTTSYTRTVGDSIYTISVYDPETGALFYTPPSIPNSTNSGSLSFFISVRPTDIAKVPEPSTLALSCIGLAALGLRKWRKRRQLLAATA